MKKYLSELRAVSCLGVVILHTIRLYFSRELLGRTDYLTAGCIKDLMNFAVPCFLMITGALLLDAGKELSLKKIWRKYIAKTVLCLLVCITVFTCFDAAGSRSFEFPEILFEIVSNFWKDGSWAHLWYLYMLIGMYAMLPVYRIVTKHAGRKEILYLVAVWTIFLVVLPMAGTIVDIKPGFTIGTASVFPMCLFLGFALENGYMKLSGSRLCMLFAISIGLTVVCSLLAYGYEVGKAGKLISTYAFLPVLVMSVCVYSGWKRISPQLHGLVKKGLSAADRCSFGIYLIHLLTLRIFHLLVPLKRLNCAGVLGISVLVFAASWMAVCIWQKFTGDHPFFK